MRQPRSKKSARRARQQFLSRRKHAIEPLEAKILLAADLVFDASNQASHGFNLALTQVGEELQLLDRVGGDIVKSQPLVDNSGKIYVIGSDFDDALTVDDSLAAFSIRFDGGLGSDHLLGPASDSDWRITGENAGDLNDNVIFAGVENLVGAVDNEDTFYLEPNGLLSGVMDGSARGFDSLVLEERIVGNTIYTAIGPDAGTIELDGELITYAGLEPITDNTVKETLEIKGSNAADQIVVRNAAAGRIIVESQNATFESVSFPIPTQSLTVDGLGGDDTVTVQTVNLGGADFEVKSEAIVIGDGAIVSSTGDITLSALQTGTKELENLSPILVPTKTTSITIGEGARISGNDIEISARSEDRTFTELLPAGTPGVVKELLIDELLDPITEFLALPFKVLVKKSDASITIEANVQLSATGGIDVEANAVSDATGIATSDLISAGYVSATTSAIVDVKSGVKITADDSIGIPSEGDATASMTSETSHSATVAVSKANVTAHTLVAKDVEITAGGLVNITATGSEESSSEAEAGLDEDGRAGLAFGLDFSNADVKTNVDAKITANVKSGLSTSFEFDPTVANRNTPGFIDTSADTVYLGQHGLSTGDSLSYSTSRGNPIGLLQLSESLANGEDYYVITTNDPNKIKLAKSERDANAGAAISLAGGASLNSKIFNVASAVDSDADSIKLDNPAFAGSGLDFTLLGNTFAEGQAVVYDAGGNAPIRGLQRGGNLLRRRRHERVQSRW